MARIALKEIDLDFNKKVSFIEYCLWKYSKSLEQLFEEVSFVGDRPCTQRQGSL